MTVKEQYINLMMVRETLIEQFPNKEERFKHIVEMYDMYKHWS